MLHPFFRCFWLMRLLEQTMTSGGFLTKRLFVPRQIWYQQKRAFFRLAALETKIHTCQTLATSLDRMVAHAKKGMLTLLIEPYGGSGSDAGGADEGSQDQDQEQERERARTALLKELDAIDATVLQLWLKLSKKLSFISRPGKHPGGIASSSSGVGSGSGIGATISLGTQQQSSGQSDEGDPNGDGNANGSALDSLGLDELSPLSATVSSATSPFSIASSFFGEKGVGSNSNGSGSGFGGNGSSSGGGQHKRGVSAGVAVGSDLKSQWKNFSKTVQKTIGTDKGEDASAYTESAIQLFQSSYFLESMLRHYNVPALSQTHLQIINRLRRLCEFLNLVVCAFIVRDLGELMVKHVKRVGAWTVADLSDK
ncbi:hypothetical protein BGX28_001268 [Mortierella sp. GBA30]|nr:hypothetical protein BGX28_001268 [Mortierella sp. GBA30]